MSIENRPWGSYTVLHTDESSQVKKLIINPGKRISLQSHELRAEHWFVVSGTGLVTLNTLEFELYEGNAVDIRIGEKHRIECISKEPLIFIEVQTGSKFDESDILRFEDDYQREIHEI
jgi:mannose-6-phosphate isomerase-like protein (cupin superfamily)